MKRFLSSGALSVLLLAGFIGALSAQPAPSPSSPPATSSTAYAPRRVIVKLAPALPRTDADAVRSSFSAHVRARFANIDAEVWDIGALPVSDAVKRLEHDRRVEFVEPDYVVHATAVFPADPKFPLQWYLHNSGEPAGKADADIDAPEAWTTATGAPVLVGVLDTGVDLDHEDLKSAIFTNVREIPGNGVDDDDNGYVDDVHGWNFVGGNNDPRDDNGHGTHVSGLVAAPGNNGIGMAGVCWTARVIPLKFLDSGGNGYTSDAILALQYAQRMGARIVNLSWGGFVYSTALRRALVDLSQHGVLCVAASGNDGVDASLYPLYPAGYKLDNMVSVASTDRSDALSSFSDYGSTVDLAAPGSEIVSAFPGNRYVRLSGTSMSCAIVSGAACLLWSRAPYTTDVDMKAALLASVDRLPALDGRLRSGGRLNLQRLVSNVDAVVPAPVTTLAVDATASNAVRLAWFATGDDGGSGTASAYELRYATAPITAGNFSAAKPVAGVPHPQMPGSAQSFEVAGLSFGTTYYFALVVVDEAGNRSAISNVANATTLGIPTVEIVPDAFSATLFTGGTATKSLTITNTGAGTLDFSVPVLPAWVHLDPASGRIAAGESRTVRVVFDAAHMPGGAYNSAVIVASNDPNAAGVPLTVALQVNDAPDITVNTAVLDCGTGYIAACAEHDVVVTNAGTAALHVGSVNDTESPFVAPSSPFLLGPGESRAVQVFFCPQATGKYAATLSIPSDDPDRPLVTVTLQGRGVMPPVASAEPAAISVDLYSGGTATRTISLSNTGGSTLDYVVSIPASASAIDITGASPAANGVMATAHPVERDVLVKLQGHVVPQQIAVRDGKIVDRDARSTPSSQPARELVLPADGNHFTEVFGSAAQPYFGSEIMRGNIFQCTTPTNLKEYRFYLNPTVPAELWFVVYEGDSESGLYLLAGASNLTPSPTGEGWYSSGDVNVHLSPGRYYMMAATFLGETGYFLQRNITPYPIAASFGSLVAGAGWSWGPYTSFPPSGGQIIPDEAFGDPVAYYQATVTDGVVRWLSVSPEKGSVPRTGTTVLSVGINTAGLLPGDHDAVIRIASNDPATPSVDVPVQVHVNAAPDIALPSGPVDFGECFTGLETADTMLVRNAGAPTQFLDITHLSCDNNAFTVTPASLFLAPGELASVIVKFRPGSAGAKTGTLTFTSNDPDEPVATMSLRGTGRQPPQIAVASVPLVEAARPGETRTRTVSIVNSGESALNFDLSFQKTPPPGAAGKKILPRHENSGAVPGSGDAPPAARASTSYSGHGQTAAASTRAVPRKAPAAGTHGMKVLALFTGAPGEILDALSYDPDIATLDGFNAELNVPTFADLAPYDAVLMINDYFFKDPRAVGNALADYVDDGGSVIVTLAAFIQGYAVRGRFGSGGYLPFEIGTGPAGSSVLGDFDAQHPIMDGILFIYGGSLGNTTPVANAKLIASWQDGRPLVDTTKRGQVIGMNIFIGDSEFYGGDVLALIHNALTWTTSVRWLSASPPSGVVAPHQRFDVKLTFDGGDLAPGKYSAVVRVGHNDPFARDVEIPVSFAVDSTVTAVGDTPLPMRYALEANHPNPFNPVTTIAYDIAQPGRSRLVVYDVNGARIRELVDTSQRAGHYLETWDGRDDRGAPVASGVYFYRLTSGTFSQTRKMVLLK